MIVKNESKIILRLFESVCCLIDSYCICDTGSTDNTREIIYQYFSSKGIPGKIIQEPFKNFSHNRNVALQACMGMSDYVLLLDADMILENKCFDKRELLKGDIFNILQGSEEFYYENARIVRNNGKFFYRCVTHEYIDRPPNSIYATIGKNMLFIRDIGDGGSKSDKFERDIRLLLDGLKEDPRNERYHFYLANSYHDSGKYEEAIHYYKMRIEFGGWEQEVWYSYFRIGMCYRNQSRMPEAINAWMEGYNYFPERVENLHEIIQYYRWKGENRTAMVYYNAARHHIDNPSPRKDSFLFLHNEIYTHKLYYEYTIIACYNGIKNINREVVAILNHCREEAINSNLLSNMKFYKDILTSIRIISLNEEYSSNSMRMTSSSPCIIQKKDKTGYWVNVRYVNYRISEQGEYLDCDQHVVSMNKCIEYDNSFNIIQTKLFDIKESESEWRRYVGVEDVRIFPPHYSSSSDSDSSVNKDKDKDLFFIGTGFHKNERIGVVIGKYDLQSQVLEYEEYTPSFKQTDCEKNWVFGQYSGCCLNSNIIYNWFPLQVCIMNQSQKTKTIDLVQTREMPMIFRYARGSTSASSYFNKKTNKKEEWFIVHIVSYESPRHYYHMIVVLDDDMKLLRYSAPLKLSDQPIEYCLGLVVQDDQVLISFSVWDRSSNIGIYDKDYIDSLLVY
jgi:tetratricopeptide (TPR) repeat protein